MGMLWVGEEASFVLHVYTIPKLHLYKRRLQQAVFLTDRAGHWCYIGSM